MQEVFYSYKIFVKISWLMVSGMSQRWTQRRDVETKYLLGASRRWTQRRDVEKIPLGSVATWKSNPLCNVATLVPTS